MNRVSFAISSILRKFYELIQAEVEDMLSRLESMEREETAVRQRLSDLQLESVTSKSSSKESVKKKSSLRINQTPSVLQAGEIVQENCFMAHLFYNVYNEFNSHQNKISKQ